MATMVLILDGNQDHVTHVLRKVSLSKKYQICDCPRSTQMPETDKITEITPHERIFF